jgi:hypothetical protein
MSFRAAISKEVRGKYSSTVGEGRGGELNLPAFGSVTQDWTITMGRLIVPRQ